MKALFGKADAASKMDETGFSRLFRDYQELVYRTAYLILGTREEAEDTLQDVFLKIFQSFGTYDPGKGAFSTWIYRITINHCLKYKTRFAGRSTPLSNEQESIPVRQSSETEEDRDLFEALAQLTIDQRILVALRYGWQLSYDEIAQTTGKPLGTIKSRHARVIEILYKYYSRSR